MNYSEKIFEMLGVKPYEEFKINEHFHIYRLTEKLLLEFKLSETSWVKTDIGLSYLLNGTYIIKKILQPTTEKEKLALDYAKTCGYKWIAKEKDRTIVMFDKKPIRGERHWFKDNWKDKANILEIPLSFIEWEDEPYYIGD